MKYGDYLLKWKEKVKGMRDLNHFCLLKGVEVERVGQYEQILSLPSEGFVPSNH